MGRTKSSSIEDLSDCLMNNPKLVQQLKLLGFDTGKDGMTFKEAMVCAQIASAVKGDKDSYKNVMNYANTDSSMPLEAFIKDNGGM